MLKVKCCRSCTAIFMVVLSVFHMQSCQVITTEKNGSLDIDILTKTDNKTTPSCRTGQFYCQNCVFGKLLCDGEAMCYDGKDEADCWCNVFLEILDKDEISMNEGDTFNMTCLVSGQPYQPIPIEMNKNGELVPKCASTGDLFGPGVMTCPNIDPADEHYHEGVYSSVAKIMDSCSLSWVCSFATVIP